MRLNNDRADFFLMFFDDLFKLPDTGHITGLFLQLQGAPVAIGRWRFIGLEEKRSVDLMKEVNTSDTDRSDSVAMIAIRKTDKFLSFAFAFLLPVLIGHFQGNLYRC